MNMIIQCKGLDEPEADKLFNWKKNLIEEVSIKLFDAAGKAAYAAVEPVIEKNATKPSNLRFKNKDLGFQFSGKIYVRRDCWNTYIKLYTLPPLHPDLIPEFIPFKEQMKNIERDQASFEKYLTQLWIELSDNGADVTDVCNITPDCLYSKLPFDCKRTIPNPYPNKLLLKEITRLVNQYSLYKVLV